MKFKSAKKEENEFAIERANILDVIDSEDYGRTIAIDTETTGLDPYGPIPVRVRSLVRKDDGENDSTSKATIWPDRPHTVSFTNGDGICDVVDFPVDLFTREVLYSENPEGLAKVKAILEDPTITKVFHNSNFDIIMLKFAGVETKGKIFDTLNMAHVHNSSLMSFGLKPLSKNLLAIPDDDLKALKKSVQHGRKLAKKEGWARATDLEADYHLGDQALVQQYAMMDTFRTMALYWCFKEVYDEDPKYKELVDMELELLHGAIQRMQLRGISTDQTVVEDCRKYYSEILDTNKKKLDELGYGELNTNSSPQMMKAFYEDMKEEPVFKVDKKTREQKRTCDGKALEKFAKRGNKVAETILRVKAGEHQMSSFIDPLSKCAYGDDFAVHPSYRTAGPVTGRISCTKPNLMNISSDKSAGKRSDVDYRVRECFVPREGHVLYFPDYSQIEIWLTMFLAGDKTGMTALMDGADMHAMLANRIWGTRTDFETKFETYRKMGKMAGFGMVYGAGVDAIQELAGCSRDEAKNIRSGYLDLYSGIRDYMAELGAQVRQTGHIINPFGRKYYIDPDHSYKALNYMIQGTASEIMKRALINTYDLFQSKWVGSEILLNIHDEQCDEVPLKFHSKKIMIDIVEAMQGNFHDIVGLPKPLPVGMKYTTTNWSEVIELENL